VGDKSPRSNDSRGKNIEHPPISNDKIGIVGHPRTNVKKGEKRRVHVSNDKKCDLPKNISNSDKHNKIYKEYGEVWPFLCKKSLR